MFHYSFRTLLFFRGRNLAAVLIISVASLVFTLLVGALDSFSELISGSGEAENVTIVTRGGLGERWPEMSYLAPSDAASLGALQDVAIGSNGEKLISVEYLFTAKATHHDRTARVAVRGVDAKALQVHRTVTGTLGPDDLLVGANVEAMLGDLKVGDEISFAGRNWRVGGFLRPSQRQSPLASEIWAPIQAVMHARQAKDYSTITLRLPSANHASALVSMINADTTSSYKHLRAVPETAIDDSMRRARGALKMVQVVITIMVMGVAGAAVISLLLNNVLRRRRDVAMLRALGTSSPMIMAGFCFESVLLSAVGGALGSLLALAASGAPIMAAASLERMSNVVVRLHFDPKTLLLGFGISLLLAVPCSLIPSFFATRVTVRQELRGE